jgi:predicted nucleotidyltransferase
MRLLETQRQAIKTIVADIVGPGSRVWLFGSRVDDTRRGGDVDLYVEPLQENTLIATLRCKIALEDSLDLDVDLIIKEAGEDKPIYRLAKTQGVLL